MTYPRSREGAAPKTVPLEDLTLSERESVFTTPRAGDVALLGVLVAVLLGNGVWIWRQLGADSHAGRAVFFGLLLLCVYWCAIVYTFKLSLSARLSPRSVSVVRGPWHVEIRWSELARLMERIQALDGRRYRWIIAIAHDGRRISVREDAIADYARFRREAYERYRVYRDHGGTWGATGSGPFIARETIRDEARWWAIGALMVALLGLYFSLLLPETNPLGYALLAIAVICLVMLIRAFLLRQRYTIDRSAIEARTALRRTRLTWAEISKVERTRHPVGGVILASVALGRLILRLASRGDSGIRSFAWAPRVPEYLTLRGGGRQARVRLHHLMQPDELLAWIEFYDTVRRSASGARSRPTAGAATGPVSQPVSAEALTPDMSGAAGPLDPWGAGRQGEPVPSQPMASDQRSPEIPFVARTPTHAPDLATHDYADAPVSAKDAFDLFADHVASVSAQPNEPDHTDLPTIRTPAASQDDAWLRETGAQPSVAGSQPTEPRRPTAAPQIHQYQPEPPQFSQPTQEHWRQTSPQQEPDLAPHPASTPLWSQQPESPLSSYVEQHTWRQEPAQNDAVERDIWQAEPAQPSYVESDGWAQESWEPGSWRREPEAHIPTPLPATAPEPEPHPFTPYEQPTDTGQAAGIRWDTAWRPDPQARPSADTSNAAYHDAHEVDGATYEEDEPTSEIEVARPWRDDNWQPPALPRFGPSGGAQTPRDDEAPDHGR